AVSCTGQGEYFIRVAAAARTAFGVAAGQSLAEASQSVIDRIGALGGDGGLIALDREGNIAAPLHQPGHEARLAGARRRDRGRGVQPVNAGEGRAALAKSFLALRDTPRSRP